MTKGRHSCQPIMDNLSAETSIAETVRPVRDKDDYLKILEDNMDKLKSKIDEFVKNQILMAKKKASPNLIKLAKRAEPE